MRKEYEGEFDLVQFGDVDWLYWMPSLGFSCDGYQVIPGASTFEVASQQEQPIGRISMSQKILVPLDGSEEAATVLPIVRDFATRESEVILLQVIPPGKSQRLGEHVLLGSQMEEAKRSEVMTYLRQVTHQLGETTGGWRCEVAVSNSVAEEIVDFAIREEVDLISMYTHDRKGLAKLIKGSIAKKVQRSAPIEVQVIRPRELVAR